MAEVYLDCLGEACPVPLIKTQNKIKEIDLGDILVVEVDHSCAMKNVPEWARKEGYPVELEEVEEGRYDIFIEKNK